MYQLYPFPIPNEKQYLLKMSHINVRQGRLSEHDQDFAELIIALEGQATNIINGISNTILPGDIFLVLPGMRHEMRNMINYKFCIFKFDYNTLMQEAKELKNLPGFQLLFVIEPLLNKEGKLKSIPTLDLETLSYAEMVAKILENELKTKSSEYEIVAKNIFLSLLSLVSRRCIRKNEIISNRHALLVADAVSFMEAHYKEKITLDDIAGLTHYSRRHFTRLFRQHFSTSPMTFLNQIRLRNAIFMLRTTNLSITDIAQECGFEDSSLFCRNFKQYYKMSPGKCRKTFIC